MLSPSPVNGIRPSVADLAKARPGRDQLLDRQQTEGLVRETHVVPLMPYTGLPDDFRE
jgi:hypothetical protein